MFCRIPEKPGHDNQWGVGGGVNNSRNKLNPFQGESPPYTWAYVLSQVQFLAARTSLCWKCNDSILFTESCGHLPILFLAQYSVSQEMERVVLTAEEIEDGCVLGLECQKDI
jgi:hypothetical protein